MKNKILSFIFIVFLSNVTLAQVKVLSNGRMGIGTSSPQRKLEVKGNTGSTDGLIISNTINNNVLRLVSSNPGAEIGTADDQITFYYGGHYNNIIVKRVLQVSDERFKKNINAMGSTLNKIMQIKPVSYNMKSDKSFASSGKPNDKNLGFIAQDLLPLFPELVKPIAKNGYYAVDYVGLIPVLVKGMQEQQKQLDKQQKEIKKLNKKLGKENKNISKSKNASNGNEKSQTTSTSTNTLNKATKNSRLQQNAPNPFSESTEIRYTLADNFRSARLYIFNMQGNEIKEYTIYQPGSGSIRINGAELNAGMYLYSLVVDKQIIDTKRMILTKK